MRCTDGTLACTCHVPGVGSMLFSPSSRTFLRLMDQKASSQAEGGQTVMHLHTGITCFQRLVCRLPSKPKHATPAEVMPTMLQD